VKGRLAGRVARSDDVDVEPIGGGCFALRGTVRDALAQQLVAPVQRELPPGDTAGDDDRACVQDVAAVEVHLPRRRIDPGDRAGDENLRAEPLRLLERPTRQLLPGDTGRKAEVVLDP
jgi:hypothetical protein